jgi:hypothetical protein
MSSNSDPLIFEFVRRLNARVDALASDLHVLQHRVAQAEQRLAALTATEAIHRAGTQVRLDRLEAYLDRIVRCLEAPDRAAEA